MSRCLVCGVELEPVDEDAPWHCHGGMAVEVLGGYGSRVYDPILGHSGTVMGAICDGCATTVLPRLWVVESRYEQRTDVKQVRSWEEV